MDCHMTTAASTDTALQVVRSFNRQVNGLRPITLERGYIAHAPGSVLVTFGYTKVLVTVSVEDRVPKHIFDLKKDNHGWLTAEYAMLPGATHTRNQRERNKPSGRTAEIQRLIGRSLRTCLDLTQLGQRTLTVDADVIQADGGTRVAAITGASVALFDAVTYLKREKNLTLNPWLGGVAAVSVGVIGGIPMLDLDYSEDSTADVDANVVMNTQGQLIECQATSEHAPFDRAMLDALLNLAEHGIGQLQALQEQAKTQQTVTLTV
jgi:ribonuclease PH